jgi:hypothetical protein
LGFAAQYNVPVIGPDAGLLGALIKAHGLGYVYKKNFPDGFASALKKYISRPKVRIDGRRYMEENSVLKFQRLILE